MIKELLPPPTVVNAAKATEVVSGWVVDGMLHCSLLPELWQDEPETWGILLTDITNHVANALFEMNGTKRSDTIDKIKNMFLAELSSPTDRPEGGFI